jgi:S1-C subfamily serine protease
VSASALSPDVKLTPPQIAKAGNQSVLIVTGYDSNDQPLGQANGYVYSSNGIIVTSYSAIRGASDVAIETPKGDELNVIALMGYSPVRDLAVLAVLEGNLAALETGAGEVVKEGDSAVVIGPDHALSQGIIGPRRAIGGVDLMPINTQAFPGSPVLNEHGRVIGLIVKRVAGANAAFAIPSHYISDLLAEHRTMSFAQMLEETGQPAAAPSKPVP